LDWIDGKGQEQKIKINKVKATLQEIH